MLYGYTHSRAREKRNHVNNLLTELKSCGMRKDLQWGRRIHIKVVANQQESNTYVVKALIKMYVKCESIVEARWVFDSIQKPDVVSWTVLIFGYVVNGEALAALELFSEAKARGCMPNSITYIAAVKACTSLALTTGKGNCLKLGKEIHLQIGCFMDYKLQVTLIDMYAKCGSMLDAHSVFDSISNPDVVSWTALLLGYTENGEGHAALELFSKMKDSGIAPDSISYIAALKSCTSLAVSGDKRGCLERGREIHTEIGCYSNQYLQNTLIDMYAKCGSMVDARRVFDSIKKPDVVAWNAAVLGYAENGEALVSLDLFAKMKAYGALPNSVSYVAALKACTCLAVNGAKRKCLERGRKIHSQIGCHLNRYVENTLVDMYAKSGSMRDARHMFDSIHNPDLIAWNALLLGYAENGEGLVALEELSKMETCGFVLDSVTYVAALKACGLTGALALGRKFHSKIREFTSNVVTCLVDFYAKCGSMVEAREVFNLHSSSRVPSTWTALLSGYARFGDIKRVFNLFEAMQDEGFRPDSVTFLCLLWCCSHAGLEQKARDYFEAMPVRYGVSQSLVHYNCMVDVLGRVNQLNEGIAVLQKMPCNPDAVTWRVILDVCRKRKNVGIGRLAFQSLVDMNKKDACAYVVMAHIYGSRGMWDEQEKVLQTRSCTDFGLIRTFL